MVFDWYANTEHPGGLVFLGSISQVAPTGGASSI